MFEEYYINTSYSYS